MHGASLDNNPSPGNKRGGLTTILEKSLGAVAKGGRSPLTAVYHYAERVTEHGLVFMDTPGYDPVSATGQVAGGANVITFTTGRGSCFGSRPCPSIKLTSNTALYRAMEEDMAAAFHLHEDPIVPRLRKSVGERYRRGHAVSCRACGWPMASRSPSPPSAPSRTGARARTRAGRAARRSRGPASPCTARDPRRLPVRILDAEREHRQPPRLERLAVAHPHDASAVSGTARLRLSAHALSSPAQRCARIAGVVERAGHRFRDAGRVHEIRKQLVSPCGMSGSRCSNVAGRRSRAGWRCHRRSSAGDTMNRCIRWP